MVSWRGQPPIHSRRRSRNPVFHFRPALQNCAVSLSFLYTFLVPLASQFVQKTMKIELESNNWKNRFLFDPILFLAASWTRYGPPLRASETLWPSKGQCSLEPARLDSQNPIWGLLPLQVYHAFSNRGPRAIQETTIWHAPRRSIYVLG